MGNTNFSGIGMTSQRTRDRMISRLKQQGISDRCVLSVMRKVPRHCFVEEALASRAYEDTSLPIGFGQTISRPYIVARMTELLLQTQPMQHVLEVGTGSGYQAAILSRLVRRLQSVERIKALCDLARLRFRQQQLRNIRLRHSDGGMGMPQYAPYDGIIVTAAPEGIPHALVEQLRPGGVIIMPIGDSSEQILIRVLRTEDGYEKEFLERVSFVPLLGGVS